MLSNSRPRLLFNIRRPLVACPRNPDFRYLVKKQSAHAAKLKLLYEQCGNHAEEYYPNIISNYGEELPVECEHEINSLFPSKRISGTDFVLNLSVRTLVHFWLTSPSVSEKSFIIEPAYRVLRAVRSVNDRFGNPWKFITNQRSLHQNVTPPQVPIQSTHHHPNFLTMRFRQNLSVSLILSVTNVSPMCHQSVIKVSPINKFSQGRADSRASTIRGYSTMSSLPKVHVSELEKGIKNYGLRKASRHDDLSPLRGQSKQKSKKSKSKSTSGSYKIEIHHPQFLIFHLV